MKPEILVLGTLWTPETRAQLCELFDCHFLAQLQEGERADLLASAGPRIRGVLTTGVIGIDGTTLVALPALEIVAVHGVGVDAVPRELVAARGVRVTNTPDVLTEDVADLAVGLLLACVRRLPMLDRYVRSGQWEARVPLAHARSLRGKVAGIVGFGRIGQAVAQRLTPFGLEIRYFQRSEGPEPQRRSSSLLALARESDMLIVCTPGGAATQRLIDAEVLDTLGPEGTLVNIARGSVVDEAALVAALASGRLGAAALDVFENEPQVPQALFEHDNVVLTPHVGSNTVESRRAMAGLAVANLVAHFRGEPLPTPVVF
ncbi:2-hydroxyacid dehydrogenase [Massilia niabensis]|uniref:2-hydroxyacid dehydrogenase n=1 Tax=Massilia niabensis TaxID=544910 RepID=A0ABW0LAD5_9BURK